MTKQVRTSRRQLSAKDPKPKRPSESKDAALPANGIHGFMFSSPMKSSSSSQLNQLSTHSITPRLLFGNPATSSTTSKSFSAAFQLSSNSESEHFSSPICSPSAQSVAGNDLFSPYPCAPRHKYLTRSNVSKFGFAFDIVHTHSNDAEFLSVSAMEYVETEEFTKSNIYENSFKFVDGLDTSDLETEEALDSFELTGKLSKLSDSNPPKKQNVLPDISRTNMRTTLVLDLDETLVHCSTDPNAFKSYDRKFTVRFQNQDFQVFAKFRPHVQHFLQSVSQHFEVVIFTASQQIYADKLLDLLDPEKQYTKYRLFRDSCAPVEGTFVKDLRILGRDMSRVVIVDNALEAFSFQLQNGVPIKSWFDDENDTELLHLSQFLEALRDCKDVRPIINKRFGVMSRIEANILKTSKI